MATEKNNRLYQTQLLPYERFLRFGPENLTEAELLAIIIRTGTKDCNALQLAEKVLSLAKFPHEDEYRHRSGRRPY